MGKDARLQLLPPFFFFALFPIENHTIFDSLFFPYGEFVYNLTFFFCLPLLLPVASLRKKYSSHRNVTRNETSKKKKIFSAYKRRAGTHTTSKSKLKKKKTKIEIRKRRGKKKSVKMRATKKKNCLRSVRMSFEKMQNARRVM